MEEPETTPDTTPATTLEHIGSTPLVELERIYVKLECSNPSGSVKDRIARFMLLEAKRRGELQEGDTIVEATSGNTGIALAMVGRELGHRVIVYMPEHMSEERREFIRAYGAEVRSTPREQGFEGPIATRDTFKNRPGYYVPDQFGNPDNARCHRETTGAELLAQLRAFGVRQLDAFVAGVGTGGTLMGVGAALREHFPRLQLVAVEPTESNVMCGGPAGPHAIQGIGDGFIPPIVDLREVSDVIAIPSDMARATASEILERHGHCVGFSAGANLAAARLLSGRGLRVATLFPDCADRYGSLGLHGPSSHASRCPLAKHCAHRVHALANACRNA
jgi:cysteine synthase A